MESERLGVRRSERGREREGLGGREGGPGEGGREEGRKGGREKGTLATKDSSA